MDEKTLEAKITKLKNLPQYKDKSDDEMKLIIKDQIDKAIQAKEKKTQADSVDVEELFTDKEEKKLARYFLAKYLEEFDLDNISDKTLLKELIYLEVFQKTRLQKSAEDFQKNNGSVPLQILDSIHKNLDKIVSLKECLGLTKDSKGEQNDAFKALELLKKKAEIWRENNQASRTLSCPYCSKMIMLKIRTTAWEAQQHPFFKDRLLGNSHLIKLYKDKVITKKDVALILEVSDDYIDWLCDKWERILL